MLTGGYWDELPLPVFFETATTTPLVLSKLFETYSIMFGTLKNIYLDIDIVNL